ncbi:MAG: hypothetical protein OEW68_15185 [Gammaproteobacteria bacterium]|nr:hypothetical protein [Gammaproteobacteria bacterium]MDH4316171.1 hypothetical protein [Gammaproteobacteria bacterium]
MKSEHRLPRYQSAILAVFSLQAIPGATEAASEFLPDVKLGANYINAESFEASDSVNDWGGNIDARLDYLWFDERGRFVISPRISSTQYGTAQELDRDSKSLGIGWTRSYATAEASLGINYSRLDLVSSEFGTVTIDPDGEVDAGSEDSGIVGNGDRDRIGINGLLAKNLSQRGDIVFAVDYLDNTYNEDGPETRIDFSQGIGSVGWRWRPDERTALTFSGGARQYDADNNVNVDSSRVEAMYERSLSETSNFFAAIGYEQLDGQQGSADLGSDDVVPFRIGASRDSLLGTYSIELAKFVNPVSTGRFDERTQLTLLAERSFSERLTGAIALVAYQAKALGVNSTQADRDFFSGRMEMYWAMTSKWYLGVEFYHSQQDFSDLVSGADTKVRSEVFFNIRYKSQSRTQR